MTLEALLAYFHITAILAVVVFLTSQAALCRTEWLNASVVRRLAKLDRIYVVAAMALLLTGLARTIWGIKGFGWYWSQPLLHLKFGLFIAIGLISIKPTSMYLRWNRVLRETGALPDAAEVKTARRFVMIEAHLLILVPLAATLLARGVLTK